MAVLAQTYCNETLSKSLYPVLQSIRRPQDRKSFFKDSRSLLHQLQADRREAAKRIESNKEHHH